MFFWHADCYLIWDRNFYKNIMVYQRKWLEDHVHVVPPPKSQFRGQGIHTRFRCMIWEMRHWKHLQTIIWIAQFILPFVTLICVHTGQNTIIRNSNKRVRNLAVSREPWDISEVIRDKHKINKNIPGLGPQKTYSSRATSAAEKACLSQMTRDWRTRKWNTKLAYYYSNIALCSRVNTLLEAHW